MIASIGITFLALELIGVFVLTALSLVIFSVGVGVIFYGFVTLKTDLAQKILGSKIESILVKFHIHD